ncbi:dihydrolipoamide acetyltransferase family protein [Pseudonocardia acidicola]|nr:dihydrolipoamide acetyltransferase family protein [Pseudonocardia acidicola]
MPDVGEGLTEAEIISWHVAPGDMVAVNQIIVEIETAKAAVELPSPFAGTVGELLAEPGQTVEVGTPIIAIETGAPAAGAAAASEGGTRIGEAGAGRRIPTLVGYGPRQGTVTRRPRRAGAPGSTAPPSRGDQQLGGGGRAQRGSTVPDADHVDARGGLVPLAKPPVRKLARDLGVDLHAVTGSGPGGVITRDDVQAVAAGAAAEPEAVPAPAPVAGGVRREPIRGVRKATAAAMVSSAFTAPHVTEFLAVDVTATMALRDRLRGSRAFAGIKLTPLAFVAKAVCLAARRTPEVNASWDDAAGEIVYYDRMQLGIAAATPRGLIVPKIRDADMLDLLGLATALGELTETARAGRTPPAGLVGGTFTITNVGVFGVDTGTPIVNPGEAAILAVGAIKPTPWVVDGELAVRTVCQLALSFDHRLVDGEQGSRFLADVGALLEDPGIALTW